MFRLISCFLFVIGMTALTGCRVCSSPYDYCGPVNSMGGGDCGSCGGSSCDPLHRSGSTLNGYSGGRVYDGYYSGTAQPQPYNDGEITRTTQTMENGKSSVPSGQKPTKARVITPSPTRAPVPSGSSSTLSIPALPPEPLTRDAMMQQERGAVDVKLIDVKDSVIGPLSNNGNKNSGIRQVSYEEIVW